MANKHLSVGPGGIKCLCCFPPPGKRKAKYRSAKRKEKKDAMKQAEKDMQDDIDTRD